MKTNSRLSRKLQLAFGAAILVLLVVGAISYRGIVESTESDLWVRHTHGVLEKLQDLLAAMQTVESNLRGYLLTGDESFLEVYRAAIAKTEEDQTIVRNLTADNAGQQRRLDALATRTSRQLQIAEQVLNFRRTNGLEAATDAVREGSGKHIMDGLQGLVGQMQDEELRLLVLREADAKRRSAQTKIVLIVGSLLGLLITILAGWSVRRDNSESKDSSAKYRGLLEAAPDAMVVVNQGGEIVLLNVQAEQQFGYSRDELLGQKVKNIIPKGFAERLIADGTRSAAEALAQQIGTGIELVARRKDGSEFPIEIMLSPLESAEGVLVTAAIRDITVRRTAEKHLGQMEGKYRGLLEAAPDAMVVVNQGGELVLLNVQAEKQFGYSRDELLGVEVKNIIPNGFAERLIADGTRTAAEALAQQIGTGIELTARRKNGTEFPIEIMLSPLESAEGTLVTAAIRDISVRKAAERHLAQMEGRYRGLLEAAPDAMVVVNQRGQIVLLNVQAEKQFGYRRDELVGQKVK
ncbi:MAG: PAS domain S-box protein, partial [Candidatus Acidiferrum sp.]